VIPAALAYTATADSVIFGGRGLFRGVSILETSGSAAASVTVYDSNATGTKVLPLATLSVLQGTGDTRTMTANGIAVEQGLMIDVTGACIVTLHANPETRVLAGLGLFDRGDVDVTEWGLAKLLASLVGA